MEANVNVLKRKQVKSKRKESLMSWALISPYIIIFVIFTIIPCIMGFVFSFMDYNPYATSGNQWNNFQNYKYLFESFDKSFIVEFWSSFGTMLLFDLVAVPCLIIIPFLLAYLINFHPPGYKLFRAIIYLPSVISISIVGIIFGNMFGSGETGLINAWFHTNISWLSGKPFENDILRWIVILIASIWWQTGTNFVIFSGALRNIPKSLYEACEVDGGNRFTLLRKVTLPNMKYSIGICLFNTLIGYLGLYGQVTVLKDNSNANISVSPMMFIQTWLSSTTYAKRTGFVCACTVIFGLIVLIFSITENKIMNLERRKTYLVNSYKEYEDNFASRDSKAVSSRFGEGM